VEAIVESVKLDTETLAKHVLLAKLVVSSVQGVEDQNVDNAFQGTFAIPTKTASFVPSSLPTHNAPNANQLSAQSAHRAFV
jgi:hypothetical protein